MKAQFRSRAIVKKSDLGYHLKMKFTPWVRASFVIFILALVLCVPGHTQSAPAGSGVSLYLGPLLPKNISATDEVLNTWGLRYIMDRGNSRFFELGYTMSNSENSEFRNLDLSLRADIPIQDMTAFFLLGPDLVSYQETYYLGFHVGGGLLTHLFETTFFRTEMRFNFHPGTALLFFFGFDFHF